ncbi:unnamed protein product [Echinostoma caproni]|uniref:Endo/exonuclease/phosphatase domain-containing protein n=1 Tax=Echinostoma caproni TaxID=27848 RepID=A0A3P8H2X9_9TREM|nr:unnamed protein product [Echinostoma caproni]
MIRYLLRELISRNNINAQRPCFADLTTSQVLVDKRVLHELAEALKRNRCTPSELFSTRPPIPCSLPRESPLPEPNRIAIENNWLYRLFTQCPPTQWELLFQMEALKNWSALIRKAQLDCTDRSSLGLPALSPPCCSISAGGRIRLASWNVNRFTLAKARHPGFRETLCLTVLRARISLLVLQEVASLDVVNVLPMSSGYGMNIIDLNSPSADDI